MKKFLAVFVAVILCFGMMLMVGCGSQFDGNYSETTVSELEDFMDEVDTNGSDEIDYEKGVKMDYVLDMTSSSGSGTVKMNINAKMVDSEMQMSGTMTTSAQGRSLTVNIYYKDGWFYTAMSMGSETLNIKMEQSFESSIGGADGGIGAELQDLATLLDLDDANGFKVMIDATSETQTKIKVIIPRYEVEDDFLMENMECCFIFDAEKNLTASKVSAKVTMDGTEMKMTITTEAADVTINYPSNLGEYIDINSMGSMGA